MAKRMTKMELNEITEHNSHDRCSDCAIMLEEIENCWRELQDWKSNYAEIANLNEYLQEKLLDRDNTIVMMQNDRVRLIHRIADLEKCHHIAIALFDDFKQVKEPTLTWFQTYLKKWVDSYLSIPIIKQLKEQDDAGR